ncbi:hypothetical protein F5879DRAFT_926020 [Lentinula edodes]|uniref:uncharacterized protein n=1 Tax=Lentinula edodes TaxID=5353 RepID=UPI001BF9E85F|nr:uncharacterized protein C8R40DRAFT_1074838 [Lentinula edodes]KAF8825270.1 hypothetical protein HHX47_DHR7000063 [Lentinula edodes]KAH7868356.1 hypothetical protein C8R40DRAFT_1074838 [Lentinula edodes]KAJ3899724.1 hypothetical protein F5879DRAFT_926020 [Lentinula edodes]KAJ3922961.1 hypothetical protein F5877DRAFT_32636 [Lentinula edodes]
MSNKSSSTDGSIRRSSPIPIVNPAFNRRGRSASVSSGSSSSMSPTSELTTPLSGLSPRITVPSPGSSPILSYFLAQSPTKTQTSATLPFRKFGPAPVFEEDESNQQSMPPAAHHARRASMTVADRFSQPNNTSGLPESHVERGAGLLRRLSLSTGAPAFGKHLAGTPQFIPEAPPNTAVSPTAPNLPYPRDTKHRRATTTSSARPHRAPSPMGERILKGHFDGFN